jgi:CRP/FNR family transcriptional regulator, cyclic AMP receptor protein
MAVSSTDLKAFLVATPFFGGLSDASLDLLVSMLVDRRFDVGATVVAEGEPGRSMFIVHAGELVVSKLGDSGRVIRMAGLKPGDFFGEMTLIEMQNRSATVVAESPTVLYELTARNLYTYYKADIHAYVMVMQNINRELCRRLRRADRRMPRVDDADERVSSALRRNCDQSVWAGSTGGSVKSARFSRPARSFRRHLTAALSHRFIVRRRAR